MRTKNIFVVSLLVLASLALAACGVISARAGTGAPASNVSNQVLSTDSPRTLNVVGSGHVMLSPDLAYVTIGVHAEDPEAKAAVDESNNQTQAVVDALIEFGVDKEDIQTNNFSIYSNQNYNLLNEDGLPTSVYAVDNSVYVTVRDIDTLGDLLSAAIDAGANNIWGVQFDVADRTEAISEARSMAVDNANDKAEELAGLAEVELGQLLSISTSGSGNFPMPYGIGGGGGAALVGDAESAVPVSPGQISVSVDVYMVFEIQ